VNENQYGPGYADNVRPAPQPLHWQHPYGQPFAGPPVLPPSRSRALPTAIAGVVAVGVAAAAILLHGGATGTLGSVAGSSANGTAASATTPDYDTGVVNINTLLGAQNATAAGTGMILDSNGTVLTNNHVVENATAITATDVNTGKRYSASVVGTDANDDIAVIHLRNASGLTPVSLGDSSTVRVGQQVLAIGNAGGKGGTPSVVTGSVTALGQTITATDSSGRNAETLRNLIQVNAPIVAGDSGGPLTDSSGKVIGIDTAASASQAASFGSGGSGGFGSGSDSSGFGNGNSSTQASAGYAIPIASALTIAKQIESGQSDSSSTSGSSSDQGYLGVQVTDGGSGTVSGAAVGGTVVGSPAAAAGLSAGDVIVALNGHRVTSAADLSQLLQGSSAGQQVTLRWVDSSGRPAAATLTLMGSGA
jgi:S1-C subfamily serine protease